MMKKRLFSFFLVAVMLLGVIPMLDIMPQAATKIMTGEELASRALDVAQNYKTLYVWGGWGSPLYDANKTFHINQYPNQNGDGNPSKKAAILAASADTFAFDCYGLVKALLWGWNGNVNHSRGGATYASNGVPDDGTETVLPKLESLSSDFSNIQVGELLYMPGHVGVYIGNGLAVEATDSWDKCVMITACNTSINGYYSRNWTYHGKLPFVDYTSSISGESGNGRNGLKAETADFLSRSDGVWLFPLPQERYKGFTDWAACRGNYDCRYHPGNKHGGCVPEHNDQYGYGHNGIDIAAVVNTPVYAAAAGTVYCATTDHTARGRIVVVEHKINNDWSYYSIYQHLNSVVQSLDGKTVKAGDTIAYTGGSAGNGSIGAYHLHFGIVMARSGLGYAMSRDPYNNLSPVESSGWLLEPGFGTGGVLNNPALNSPAGYPTNPEYPAVIPNLRTHAGSVMYTFDPDAVSIGENTGSGATGNYLSECVFYPAALNVKIIETCSPYTLPCNNNTASKYNATSSKIENVFYYNGSYVPVTGIWYNTEGHYWYQLTAGDGSYRYLYSTHTDPSQTRDILPEIIDGSFPSNITGVTELKGALTGNGAKITKVQAKVFKGNEPYNGNPVLESSDNVACYEYPLYLSKIDYGLQFQTLSAGTYTLVYEVTTSSYSLNSKGLVGPFEKLTTITPYYTFTVGSTHSHSYGAWQNYDNNQHKRTCSCGSVEYQNHTWELIWQNSPSCTQSGEKAFQCSVCSTTGTESIPPTGNHIAGSWTTTKAATCTETGTKEQKCTSCGETLKTETIAATGHSWNSGVITTQPTCTKAGVKTYTCSSCKGTKTETVAATGNHTAGSWTTTQAATCTATGTKVQKCTVCAGTLKTETIPATGHSWNSGAITTQPTCTKAGVKTYTCSTCKETKTESVAATGKHVAGEWATTKAATCTEAGTKVQKCTSCGTAVNTESIPATGHSWNSGVITTSPTATTDGVKTYTCAVCSATKTEKIPATGPAVGENDPMIVVEVVNARAGETVTVSVSVKNNPGINSLVLEIDYDADKLNLDQAQFSDAFAEGAIINYNLPYITRVKSGDCSDDTILLTLTFTVLSQADIGEAYVTIKYESGDITNYEEEDVMFTVIPGGISVIEYVPGDINGDNKVNSKDLTRLLKYISHEDVFVNEDALDVNGDGKKNSKDLTRLLKYISHEDVEIY